MVQISTGRIGESGLDITVKSATGDGRCLAPTWDMVWGHKRGTLSDQEYTEKYLTLLRQRYRDDPEPFIRLVKRKELKILCYCAKVTREGEPVFCHRHLAADVLAKIAIHHGITVSREPEIIIPESE